MNPVVIDESIITKNPPRPTHLPRTDAPAATDAPAVPAPEKTVQPAPESAATSRVDHSYTASDIQVLEGLEAVRVRPSMYIGSTDQRGLHHLIYEILDNAVDEAMAGYCTRIDLNLGGNGVISVADDGRGIPLDIHPTTGKSGTGDRDDHPSRRGQVRRRRLQGHPAASTAWAVQWSTASQPHLKAEVRRDGFTPLPGIRPGHPLQ